MPLHAETPLIESRQMSLSAGRSIWLKLDSLQPPGSFKIRGVGLACETHAARGARRFVSSSGGNAGLAVAYAGRKLRPELLEELEDCLNKVTEAGRDSDQFHFCLVM